MCGIYGSKDFGDFKYLAKENEKRGVLYRSTAIVKKDGDVILHKGQDHEEEMPNHPDAMYYLGHAQSSTGEHTVFHPHRHGIGFLAHNGVISNYKELIEEYNLEGKNKDGKKKREYKIDSQMILPLLCKRGIQKGLELLEGTFGCWIIQRVEQMNGGYTVFINIFRNGSTLSYSKSNFSSAPIGGYKMVAEGDIMKLALNDKTWGGFMTNWTFKPKSESFFMG